MQTIMVKILISALLESAITVPMAILMIPTNSILDFNYVYASDLLCLNRGSMTSLFVAFIKGAVRIKTTFATMLVDVSTNPHTLFTHYI